MLFSFASSNILLSLFFAYMIQMLWSALNSLQVIVLTVLFNCLMPVNAQQVMIEIMQIVNLDIIDTRFLLDHILVLEDLPRFNMLFEEVGYDTSSFIIELGPLLFVMLGAVLFFTVKALLKLAVKKCDENWVTRKIRAKIHYTAGIIRFLLESCLELGLIAMICVSRVSHSCHC